MCKTIAMIAAVLSLAGFVQPIFAQPYNTVHDKQCEGVSGEGDAGIRACYGRLAIQADTERQVFYRRILKVVTPAEAVELTGVEIRWRKYRDGFCNTEHDLFSGGTAGLSALPTCQLALTREHIIDLQDGYGWLVAKKGG